MMIRRLFAVAALLCASLAWGQTVTPLVQPHQQFVGSSGSPCAGCSLYTYAAGTTTPQATYADASGLVPNTNPVVLDVTGSATIWLGPNPYKFQMKNPGGATLWTVDQISGAVGYLPLHGGAMSGATTTWQMDGALSAYGLQTTPTSNNGIAMSLTQCVSLPYACQVIAPALYALTEAQPFGGIYGDPQTTGPKSTDPVAQFLDQRYGVPQWIFNGSKNYDSRHGTSPTFQMNWTGSPTLTGTFVHPAFALALGMNYWMGGHSFYNDKTNGSLAQLAYQSWTEIQGGSGLSRVANCFGVGDCLLDTSSVVEYGGASTAGDQGAEDQQITVTTGNKIFAATVASVSIASDGTTTFSTSSQVENGTQGEGRILIDTTPAKIYNAGYISSIAVVGGDTQVKCSGCDWDGNFGASTKTTLTAAVANPVSGTNSFPQSNTILAVASSAGFVVGDVVGVWDYDWECEKVTAIPDGTHITLATDRKPHPIGSYVTRGGMACRGMEYEADRLTPTNTRGISIPPGYNPNETIRWVIPVMYSTAGNIAYTFQSGNTLPGQGGGYTGAAFTQMGGSGATCSDTVSGGAVTAITVSGGTGYISPTNPPQIVFSGAWTSAPSAHATGVSGSVSSAVIDSGGTGVTAATCSVVTKNPYDIYDAAKTVQVYNEVTGKVDGSKLVTEPFPVTPAVSDTIEQPIYFWQHPSISSYNIGGSPIPTLGGASTAIYGEVCSGVLQGTDSCVSSGSSTSPALYAGYPATTNAVGYGQYLTPNFDPISGAWRIVWPIQMPPFAPGGSSTNPGGYNPSVVYVGCGSIPCSQWAFPWWMNAFANPSGTSGEQANSSTGDVRLVSPTSAGLTAGGCALNVTPAGVNSASCPPGLLTSNAWFFSGQEANYAANSTNLSAVTWGNTDDLCIACTVTLTTGQADPWSGTTGTKMVFAGITSSTYNFQNAVPGGGTNLSSSTQYTACYVLKGNAGGEILQIDVGQIGGSNATLTTSPSLYCVTLTTGSGTPAAFTTGINIPTNMTIFYYGSCLTPGPNACLPPSVATGSTQITAVQNPTWAPNPIPLHSFTVATLPACSAATPGVQYAVTDATAPTFLGTLTGGGAVYTPVVCNGTAWVAH